MVEQIQVGNIRFAKDKIPISVQRKLGMEQEEFEPTPKAGDFSGRVEVFKGGERVEEQFFVEGEKVVVRDSGGQVRTSTAARGKAIDIRFPERTEQLTTTATQRRVETTRGLDVETREGAIREGTERRLEESFRERTPQELLTAAQTGGTGIFGTSTAEGTIIEFIPTEEQIKSARAGAVEEFKQRPFVERAKLTASELRVGSAKTLVGTAEFVAEELSLGGVRQFRPGEEVRGAGRLISERKVVQELRETPTGITGTIGGVATTAALIAPGVVSFGRTAARVGASTAVKEVAGGLAPVKLKSQVGIAPSEGFRTVSFKQRVGEGFNIRAGVSRTQFGVQRITTDISRTSTTGRVTTAGAEVIESPAISIRAGGTIIEEGRVVSGFERISTSTRAGQGRITKEFREGAKVTGGLEEAGGGLVITRPRFSVFVPEQGAARGFQFEGGRLIGERFGGVTRQRGDVTEFAGGEIVGRETFLGRTQRVRAGIRERGIEFDITPSQEPDFTRISGARRPARPQQPTQILDTPQAPPAPPTRLKSPTITETFIAPAAPVTTQTQRQVQTSQFATPALSSSSLQSQTGFQTLATPSLDTGIVQAPSQTPRLASGLVAEQRITQDFERIVPLDIDLITKTPSPPPAFFPAFTAPPAIAFGGFGIPSLSFPGFGEEKRPRGKKRFRRTPSLVAAGLDIRAAKPGRAEITGLTLRPIIG